MRRLIVQPARPHHRDLETWGAWQLPDHQRLMADQFLGDPDFGKSELN